MFRVIKTSVIKVVHAMLNAAIDQMSQEEKEALLEATIERFLDAMTPEEKQQLVERIIPQLLEDVEMKEVLPNMFRMMWTNLGTEVAEAGLVDKMSKMASDTGEKISDMLPERLKKLLRETQEELL